MGDDPSMGATLLLACGLWVLLVLMALLVLSWFSRHVQAALPRRGGRRVGDARNQGTTDSERETSNSIANSDQPGMAPSAWMAAALLLLFAPLYLVGGLWTSLTLVLLLATGLLLLRRLSRRRKPPTCLPNEGQRKVGQ